MYAASSFGGGALAAKLAAVDVNTIPGRVGQRIRNELVFQSTGGGEKAPAKYRLEITITERVTSTLVNQAGDSAGQIYQLDARFVLRDLADGRYCAARQQLRSGRLRTLQLYLFQRSRQGRR